MSWTPDIFIYHSPCDDGFAAAWAVHQRWGDSVTYVPGVYGRPAPDVAGLNVLVGDFSYKRPILDSMLSDARSIVILDHHKTAQEDLAPFAIGESSPGAFSADDVDGLLEDCAELGRPPCLALFDMAQSGATLTWRFCHGDAPIPDLIRYVEDRDLWRHALPASRAISLWLRMHAYDFAVWDVLGQQLATEFTAVVMQASGIEAFYDRKVAEMLREARIEQIDGQAVPVVNCSWSFASDVAHALLTRFPDAPFAACYYDRGDGRRSYSLRSEDGRADVSAIARRCGGGGHRNAAGFETGIPVEVRP